MNALGRVQAEEAGRRLSALDADVADLEFVASPLGRTRETMEIMRRSMGLTEESYRLDPRLVELSFGTWEGMTWREVRKADAKRAAERERDKWNFVPPSGESYGMLAERVRPALESLPEKSVVLSHGGVARTFMKLLAGFPEDKAPLIDIWQGQVLVFAEGRHSWH